MNESSIITPARGWQKLFASNTTAASITNSVPTVTMPSGDGVIDFTAAGAPPNNIGLCFIALGADNTTGTARVTGWRRLAVSGVTTIWLPTPLSAIAFTGCSQVGVASAALLNTERLADTLTESTAYTSAKEVLGAASADNTLAVIKIDTFGHELIQVQLAIGTATSVNALWTGY